VKTLVKSDVLGLLSAAREVGYVTEMQRRSHLWPRHGCHRPVSLRFGVWIFARTLFDREQMLRVVLNQLDATPDGGLG
jgi:hypothetical protein